MFKRGEKFYHPDKETVARVLIHGRGKATPELHFNYVNDYNRDWNKQRLATGAYSYNFEYGEDGQEGVVVEL